MSFDSIIEVLRHSSEAAVLVEEGRVSYANRAAKKLLGEECVTRSAEELLGLPLPEGTALLDAAAHEEPLLLRVSPLDGAQLVFLEPQREAAAAMGGSVLFQLRSKLQTIETAASLLRERLEDQGQTEELEKLAYLTRSGFSLARLTENAALIRATPDQTAPFLELLDLSLLLHAALDAVEEELPALTIHRAIPSDLRLVADAALLRQLLFNLISNAVQHGGATALSVTVVRKPREVLLTVADSGAGIPEERMAEVFNRSRREETLTELARGSGLGLGAARAIAQLHGGRLMLESREGAGTQVRVSLSRTLEPSELNCLRPQGVMAELCTMREVQLGLVDCLPASAFREQFMD